MKIFEFFKGVGKKRPDDGVREESKRAAQNQMDIPKWRSMFDVKPDREMKPGQQDEFIIPVGQDEDY